MLTRQRNVYLIGLAGALMAIAALNLSVDPFWVYDVVNVAGFNREKVTLHNYLYMHKAHAVYRRRTDKVILGSSGAGVGLDPDHPGWRGGGAYNLGLPGAGIREMRLYFEHFHAHRPITKMVVALDFSSFVGRRDFKPGYSEERLRPSPWLGQWATRIHDLAPTLLSASAFNQSIYDLRRNLIVTSETFTRFLENGQAEWTYHLKLVPENGGPQTLMRSVEENFVGNVWFPSGSRARKVESDAYSTLDEYALLLKTAYRDGIDTHLIVNPFHARLAEALDAAGLWADFEMWKRALVRINEEQAKAYGRGPFPIWDFSGYNSVTTETVPDDPKAVMRWFWESVHYRPELGQLVLDRVFSSEGAERNVPEDFGIPITVGNIDAVLADIRQSQAEYRRANRSYFRSISEFAAARSRNRLAQKPSHDRVW